MPHSHLQVVDAQPADALPDVSRLITRGVGGRLELSPGLLTQELVDDEHITALEDVMLRHWNGRAHVALTRSTITGLVRAKVGTARTTPHLVSTVESLMFGFAPQRPVLPDPDLFVDSTGMLANLRTGEQRPAVPSDNVLAHASIPMDQRVDREPVLRFLRDLVQPEFLPLLFELIGIAISSWRDLQIIIWLYGPPGCGKSTLLRLLVAVRAEQVPSISPHDQNTNRFAGGHLFGAGLNVVSDVASRDLTETAFTKGSSGQDSVFMDFKNKQGKSRQLWAQNVFASNTPPATSDPDNALGRRIAPVPCARQSSGPSDPDLTAKLSTPENLTALVMIGLEALFELRQRGHLTTNPAIEEARADFRRQTNAVALFLSEACTFDADATVRRADLWSAFREWADESRKGQKMGRTAFLRAIEADHGVTFKKRKGDFIADGIRLETGRNRP